MDTFQVREFVDGSIDGYRSQTPPTMCPHYNRIQNIEAETLSKALQMFRDGKRNPALPSP